MITSYTCKCDVNFWHWKADSFLCLRTYVCIRFLNVNGKQWIQNLFKHSIYSKKKREISRTWKCFFHNEKKKEIFPPTNQPLSFYISHGRKFSSFSFGLANKHLDNGKLKKMREKQKLHNLSLKVCVLIILFFFLSLSLSLFVGGSLRIRAPRLLHKYKYLLVRA